MVSPIRDVLSNGKVRMPQSTPQHNLPAPRSSFVGREQGMFELKRELATTRLMTLTGAGGSGKTRLALEMARGLVEAYPDGVWLVELAPLSEEALVPKAVAEALEVPERPAEPIADTLADVLGDRRLLLVVDNCEHLIEAAAGLVDRLLDSCPRLRILATSREGLGVEGEARWPVPPLSVPERGRTPSSEKLEGYESVRLFVERARERDPSFSLRPPNALAVADICRMLEGIPLAIELAAARVGTLSLEQISERLKDALGLLTRGGRTAVPRQRTLKGTLDWSYDLLSEPERGLFRRLSTFAGGWTLEASEAVGSGEGVEEGEVLDLLSGLVEKSMVVTKGSDKGGVRYRLLEPVRQYALERLEESGEAEAAKRAHAEYFLALSEEAEPELLGPREAEWYDRLEEEHDNIRAALSRALEGADPELGLRLAGAIWWFWHRHGHLREGLRWLEGALAKEGGASAIARAKALGGIGWMAFGLGDLERAKALHKESLALSEERGAFRQLTLILLEGLACGAGAEGDAHRGARLFGATEALREAIGFPLEPALRRLEEPYLVGARSQLDESAWTEAWEEGRRMSVEAALEYALSEEESSTHTPSSAASKQPSTPPAPEHPAGLTPREVEVLGLVAEGLTSAQVAHRLFLSPRTVEAHLTSIYHKLGVTSRAGATRFALEHGLA